jgi:hemoglobin
VSWLLRPSARVRPAQLGRLVEGAEARFLPYRDDPDHLATVKQHLRNFLGAGSGGPEHYAGRSMPEAHRGMNVSAGEYMAGLDDILGSLDKHGIDEQTRKDVLAIAYSLKDEIIHQ